MEPLERHGSRMVVRHHVVRLSLFLPQVMLKLPWLSAGGAESVSDKLIRIQTQTNS